MKFRKGPENVGEAAQTGQISQPEQTSRPRPQEESAKHKLTTPERVDQDSESDSFTYDTGWGWMVVAGSFIIWLVTTSYHYVIAVLLFDITEEFDVTVTMVTVLMAVLHFVYCLSTQILVHLVLPFTSIRILSTVSSFIYAVSTLAIAWTSSFSVFFIVSVFKYIFVGGVCIPSLNLVGCYFQQFRSFAIGVSLLGMSGAAMMTPPLTRYFKEEYGFRGSFLLLCGIELHALVASLLLRPLPPHVEEVNIPKPQQTSFLLHDKAMTKHETKTPGRTSCLGNTSSKERTRSYTWDKTKSGRLSFINNLTKKPEVLDKHRHHLSLEEIPMFKSPQISYKRIVMTILLNDCQLLLRTVIIQKDGPSIENGKSREVVGGDNTPQFFLSSSDTVTDLVNKSVPGVSCDKHEDQNKRIRSGTSDSKLRPVKRRSLSLTMVEILEKCDIQPVTLSQDTAANGGTWVSSLWSWIDYYNLSRVARRYVNMFWWTQTTADNGQDTGGSVDHQRSGLVETSQTVVDCKPDARGKVGLWTSEAAALTGLVRGSMNLIDIKSDDTIDKDNDDMNMKRSKSDRDIHLKQTTLCRVDTSVTDGSPDNDPNRRSKVLRWTASLDRVTGDDKQRPITIKDPGTHQQPVVTNKLKCETEVKNDKNHVMANIVVKPLNSTSRIKLQQTSSFPESSRSQPDNPEISQNKKCLTFGGGSSNLEATSSHFGSSLSVSISLDSEELKNPSWASKCMLVMRTVMRSKIKPQLLRNYLAILIHISYTLVYSGTFIETFIPSFALKQKETVPQFKAALLVTIIGFANMVTRLGYLYLVDMRMLRPSRIMAVTALIMAVVTSCAVFYENYGLLVLYAVVYGGVGLAGSTLNAPLIVQLMGIEDLGKMMSMCALFRSLIIAVQYPVHGYLFDETGNFSASFYCVGASYALGSVFLLLTPLVKQAQIAKEEKSGERPYRQRMVKYIRPPASASPSMARRAQASEGIILVI